MPVNLISFWKALQEVSNVNQSVEVAKIIILDLLKKEGRMGAVMSRLRKTKASRRDEDPFQNRLIVEELFRHLSFQDLKNYRLVNCLWEEIATSLVTPKCSHVKITDVSAVQQLNDLLSPFFPCTTFILDLPISSSRGNEDSPEYPVITFLENVSPWITELHLGELAFQNWENLPQGGLSNVKFPSLTTLGLTLNDSNRPVDLTPQTGESLHQIYQEFGPTSEEAKLTLGSLKPVFLYVDQLLENAPKLKQVHLTTGDCWKRLLCFLSFLAKYPDRLRITQFHYLGRPEARSLMTLNILLSAALNVNLLELHSLELQLGDEDDVEAFGNFLYSLIHSQQQTLKNFKMKGGNINMAVQFRGLTMPKLQSWEVADSCIAICFCEYTADNFPALRSLTLYTWSIRQSHGEGHKSRVVPGGTTLEELKLVSYVIGYYDNPSLSRTAFLELSQRFPRLKKLSVTANPDLLMEICLVKWPCLEQLTLVCSDIFFDVDRVIKVMAAFQGLITQLKVLEICCEEVNQSSSSAISDFSGCKLLQLNNLTCLDLRGCSGKKLVKLSWIMIRIMRMKFNVLF